VFYLTEIFLYPCPGLCFIEIAGNHERGIVCPVPSFEEIANILQGSTADILQRTDGQPVVRMFFRVEIAVHDMPGLPVGLVVIPLAFFVLYDILLVVEGFLGDGAEEPSHTIGLHPEDHLERVLWDNFIIDGAILPGSTIQCSAGVLNFFEKLVLPDVL